MKSRNAARSTLVEKVEAFVHREGLLPRGKTVAVAVSGGPDSVALLSVLNDLAPRRRVRLAVLHVNHGLRGRESGGDARFVRRLAARCGLPFHATKLHIAPRGKGSLAISEDRLRHKRYEALDELAREAGTALVALGHHRDDLAETVLMRLLRGSGPAGMGGFRPKTRRGRLTLVRPLYDCTRREILAFLRQRGLRWREDRTNRDPRWLRNRIRRELLPLLEKTYNPRLRDLLADNARWFQEDEAFFESRARAVLEPAMRKGRPPKALALETLARAAPPVLARLFRLWVMALAQSRLPPAGRQIEELIALVQRPGHRGEVRCVGDVVFFVQAGSLTWQRVAGRRESAVHSVARQTAPDVQGKGLPPLIALPSEGEPLPRIGRRTIPAVEGQSALHVEITRYNLRRQPRAFRNAVARACRDTAPDALEQFFDADRIAGALSVRNRRPADRFHPLGARGAKKLKDFLIDAKAPASFRSRLILLCDDKRILWVAGVRVAHPARLTDTTENILRLRVRMQTRDEAQ